MLFIIGAFLGLLILIVGVALLIAYMVRPSVPTNSVLVINVSGEMPDYVPDDPVAGLLGVTESNSFTSMITQLRKAKVDSRIGAVFVMIDFPMIGWAKAEELRRAISEVRAAGKPVYAYMEIGTTKEYYIATAADKIFLPPSGDIFLTGLVAEVMFFRGTLDKVGIEPQVIQIGKYKNAPDQYTRKQMSDAHREVINSLLDERFDELVSAISKARNISPEEVRALIDEAPYSAMKAKELKLIDECLYKDQVYEELKKALGYKENEKIRLITAENYSKVPADALGLNKGERIAVVFASGPINSGESELFFNQTIGSETMVRAISDAASDDSIKAIVIRIDSPGGSALASDIIWHAIEQAKAKKPVVVSMSDVAASGGYYIACNANKIVAENSTLTGSIGVFVIKPVVKGLYNWIGINNEYILRGKNAGLFRETEKWTPSEEAKMQEFVNRLYYNDFVPKVAKGRNKSVEEIDSIGQGRVWTGLQAKERGLVDEIGGLEKAIEIAKELANLPADKDVQRVTYPKPRPFLQHILGDQKSENFVRNQELIKALPANVRKAIRYASLFEQASKGDALMLMPFELNLK